MRDRVDMSPKIADTRLNRKRPIRSQLIAPMMVSTSAAIPALRMVEVVSMVVSLEARSELHQAGRSWRAGSSRRRARSETGRDAPALQPREHLSCSPRVAAGPGGGGAADMTIKSCLEHHRPVVVLFAASSAASLLLRASACSTSDVQETARSGSAEMQPASFTFAPPDGTRGVRTEHRRYEVSLVGTPLRNLEEQELRWNIEAKHSGDQYTVNQELAHVTMKHDGETLVDRDVKPGAVTAELVIDRAGNLVDVRGLEGTSKTLQSLVAPDASPAEERAL